MLKKTQIKQNQPEKKKVAKIKGAFKDSHGNLIKFVNDDANKKLILE
jgi:hypothetical protein